MARKGSADRDDDSISMVPRPIVVREPRHEGLSDEDAVCAEARERADYGIAAWSENWDLAEDDVLFAEGLNQWPSGVQEAREDQVSLTLNSIPQFIEQVTGEQRQNRPAIHVHAADDFSKDVEFSQGKDKPRRQGSQVYEGIIRAIEFNSHAESHYDTAHQHAVDGGIGWLRIIPRYANQKDFDQELLVRSVRNRWSVIMDPDIEEPDGSDAAWTLIGSEMSRAEFDKRYPDAIRGDLTDLPEKHRAYWGAGDKVRVAEYLTREPVERELLLFNNGQLAFADEVEDVVDDMAAKGIVIDRARKIVTWCVYWRKITAWSVLEGPVKMPFTTIPVVPVVGRQRDLRDGRTLYSSLIRHGKDAKRMHNYWMSAATARVALAPKAPWVGHIGAIEGYEQIWNTANERNWSFLPVTDGHEFPKQTPPAAMPMAEVQLAGTMGEMVKETIGVDNSFLESHANESGRARFQRRQQTATGSFVFADNLNRAIRRLGLLLIEAIPVIYDSERVMRLRNEDGTGDWIKVNEVLRDEAGEPVLDDDGDPIITNSLGAGEYDVVVTAGPSYATQRAEASDGMIELTRNSPDLVNTIGDRMIESQDWPGASQMAKRIRRTMDPRLLTASERKELQEEQEIDPETGQPVELPPTPAEQAAMKAAEAQAMQAQAEQASAQAEVMTAKAKEREAEARMMEAQARMLEAQNEAASAQNEDRIRRLIAQGVAEFMAEARKANGAGQQTTTSQE